MIFFCKLIGMESRISLSIYKIILHFPFDELLLIINREGLEIVKISLVKVSPG